MQGNKVIFRKTRITKVLVRTWSSWTARIDELSYVIDNAVIAKKNGKTGVVAIGTNVTVKVNGGKNVFKLVGAWEANPAEKKISHSSPLGAALMGKSVGEEVEVDAPAGKITYQIVSID